MQAGNLMAITTEPLFYGRAPASSDVEGATAETFIYKMESIRGNNGLTQPQAILRATHNFRDLAHVWWKDHILGCVSRVDQHRVQNEWAYFLEHFRKSFFKVRAMQDAVADIADLKQGNAEETSTYIWRLKATLNPQMKLSLAIDDTTAGNEDTVNFAPANFAAFLEDPVANNLALGARVAGYNAAILAALRRGIRIKAESALYEHVMRTAARNCKAERMKIFLRKTMFKADNDFDLILAKVHTEETSYKGSVFVSGSGQAAVAAIGEVDAEFEDLAAMEEDQEGDEDADYGVFVVDAVTNRPVFHKRNVKPSDKFSKFLQSRKHLKKPSKGGQKGKGGRTGGRVDPLSFKCIVCHVNSHSSAECRTAARGGFSITPLPGGPQQQSAPPRRRQGKGQGRRQQQGQGNGPEPMDTSAVQQQLQQMSLQPPQHHQQQHPYYQEAAAVHYASAPAPGASYMAAPSYSVPPPAFYSHGSGNE